MLWRKLKPGKSLSVLGSVEVAVLNKVIRTGLAKKVESRAQLGGEEGLSHANTGGKGGQMPRRGSMLGV